MDPRSTTPEPSTSSDVPITPASSEERNDYHNPQPSPIAPPWTPPSMRTTSGSFFFLQPTAPVSRPIKHVEDPSVQPVRHLHWCEVTDMAPRPGSPADSYEVTQRIK